MGYLIFTPDSREAQRGPRSAPRGQGQNKTLSDQKLVLTKAVTSASVMTKMCSTSSPDPPGALRGAQKGLGGDVTPKVSQMKK